MDQVSLGAGSQLRGPRRIRKWKDKSVLAQVGSFARRVIGYFREQTTTTEEVDRLTAREREVLELVVHGFFNKEIAEHMNAVVRWHLKHIYHKLHVHSRTAAALKFCPPK